MSEHRAVKGADRLTERGLWSPEELSDFLAVPVGTLYQWKHRGRGPRSLKVGRHLRYRPDDIEAYLDGLANGAA